MKPPVATLGSSLFFAISACSHGVIQDEEALRELDQAYAAEWFDGDADGVLGLFTEDATLVPHHGDSPVIGKEAIKNFWFNPSYPPTRIISWERDTQEIEVFGDVAVLRGRSDLTWEYDGARTRIPNGNYAFFLKKIGADWRIRMAAWTDDPREWIQEQIPLATQAHE